MTTQRSRASVEVQMEELVLCVSCFKPFVFRYDTESSTPFSIDDTFFMEEFLGISEPVFHCLADMGGKEGFSWMKWCSSCVPTIETARRGCRNIELARNMLKDCLNKLKEEIAASELVKLEPGAPKPHACAIYLRKIISRNHTQPNTESNRNTSLELDIPIARNKCSNGYGVSVASQTVAAVSMAIPVANETVSVPGRNTTVHVAGGNKSHSTPVPGGNKTNSVRVTAGHKTNSALVTGGNQSTPVLVPGGNITVPGPGENLTVPEPGENITVPVPGENLTVPVPGENLTVPVPGENITVPVPGRNITVPVARVSKIVPVARGSKIVPVAGGSKTIPVPGGSTAVSPESIQRDIKTEGSDLLDMELNLSSEDEEYGRSQLQGVRQPLIDANNASPLPFPSSGNHTACLNAENVVADDDIYILGDLDIQEIVPDVLPNERLVNSTVEAWNLRIPDTLSIFPSNERQNPESGSQNEVISTTEAETATNMDSLDEQLDNAFPNFGPQNGVGGLRRASRRTRRNTLPSSDISERASSPTIEIVPQMQEPVEEVAVNVDVYANVSVEILAEVEGLEILEESQESAANILPGGNNQQENESQVPGILQKKRRKRNVVSLTLLSPTRYSTRRRKAKHGNCQNQDCCNVSPEKKTRNKFARPTSTSILLRQKKRKTQIRKAARELNKRRVLRSATGRNHLRTTRSAVAAAVASGKDNNAVKRLQHCAHCKKSCLTRRGLKKHNASIHVCHKCKGFALRRLCGNCKAMPEPEPTRPEPTGPEPPEDEAETENEAETEDEPEDEPEGEDEAEAEAAMNGNEKESGYKCYTCGKILAFKYSLSRHEMIHTGERPHQCRFCPKTAIQRGTITQHEKSHERACSVCQKLCYTTSFRRGGFSKDITVVFDRGECLATVVCPDCNWNEIFQSVVNNRR